MQVKVSQEQDPEKAEISSTQTSFPVGTPNRQKTAAFGVPFWIALALAYSILIAISGIVIFSQTESSSKSSQERTFKVSKENVNNIVVDLQGELAEKIGLKAFAMFSRPEQTIKKLAQEIQAGIYDPVEDRMTIINQFIRADLVTQYSALALTSGWYSCMGHFTVATDARGTQFYDAVSRPLKWMSTLQMPVFKCPPPATEVLAADRDTWVANTDPTQGYILAANMHWTQALSEADGTTPTEIVIGGALECRGSTGAAVAATSADKSYSGWLQDTGDSTYRVDATVNKGVDNPGFGFAEIWDTNVPAGHFIGKTKANYDFATPMWPDNNVNGNWTKVQYMGPNSEIRTGLTSWGVTDMMYGFQEGEKLHAANPTAATGTDAYHGTVVGWFPMYLWQTAIPEIAVGLVAPLYGPTNNFIGVIDCDISVKAITNFLKRQRYGRTGVGYVVRADEILHNHGGIGMDEFINKNYNNHVGALLGVSKGSDYGKACGNDVTGGTNNYGPHYALNETEWYHAATGQRRDSTITTENVLAKVEFDAGGWTCRTVANTSVTASPENRALPARNHEDSMISESAKHVESAMGGFNALKNSQKVGSTTYTSSAGDTMLLQWFYVDELEYDGFKPLIVVVIPENDYLASITEANAAATTSIEEARDQTVVVVILSVLVTMVLSVAIAFVVTIPLNNLKKDIQKVARLEIDVNAKDNVSLIKEIGSIQTAYKGLKMGLGSFQKFVPSSVVKRIVGGDKSASELGVEKKEVTVMFTDIRNFTKLAEQLPLPKVMGMLEEYLTDMVEVIESNGGTVADFIGDGIMVFWNSPNDQPNHAQLAIDTMFGMHKKLEASNKVWSARGIPEIVARIGVNTGEALSGNIGSPVKMKFGVVGDTVNLASRVENLNKFYDSTRLVSGTTYGQINTTTVCRLVDKVAVKGREGNTLLYEVMCMNDSPDAAAMRAAAEKTEAMLNKFWAQKFSEVKDDANEFLKTAPNDGAVLFLLERAELCLKQPPDSDWDGVNHMAEK